VVAKNANSTNPASSPVSPKPSTRGTKKVAIEVDAPDEAVDDNEILNPQADAVVFAATDPQAANYLGIWDPSIRKDYTEIVNKLAPQSKIKKSWGLRNVVFSFIGFIAIQIVASVVLLVWASAHATAADTASLTAIQAYYTKVAAEPVPLVLVQFAMYFTWLGFMAWATHFRGLKSFRKDFWLKFRWFDPLLGAAIAWGAIAFEYFLFWVLPVLFPHLNLSGSDNGKELEGQTGWYFLIVGIGIGGIAGPFFEELFFRGFVMQGLIRYFRKGLRTKPNSRFGVQTAENSPKVFAGYLTAKHWMYRHKYLLAAVISSIAFGALHFQGDKTFGQWLVVIFTGSLGLMLAFIAIKTKRLGMNIFVHMFFNATSLLLPYIFK
jgi:membrane protease YdiL (CAAX protease family)